jgi:hypothetical protein
MMMNAMDDYVPEELNPKLQVATSFHRMASMIGELNLIRDARSKR